MNNVTLVSNLSKDSKTNEQQTLLNAAILNAKHYLESYKNDKTEQKYYIESYTGKASDFRPTTCAKDTYWIGVHGSTSVIVGYSDFEGIYRQYPSCVSQPIYSIDYVGSCTHGCTCYLNHFTVCYNFQNFTETTCDSYCTGCTYICEDWYMISQWRYCVYIYNIKVGNYSADLSNTTVTIYQKVSCA